MQHDPMHHDSFDNDGHLHDSFDHADSHHHAPEAHPHQNPLVEALGLGGATGKALLGHVDPSHAGLADILQLFQLNSTSQLLHMFNPSTAHPAATNILSDTGHPAAHGHTAMQPETHASPLTHFQPGGPSHLIIGDPAQDMASWYHQVHPDTCAIASQGFVIESLTGHHISENALVHEAQQHGWYAPGSGTPMYHVGDLLEAHGIHTIHKEGASLADIAGELQQHQKVLVGVNGEDFWYHGSPNDPLALYPGIPGQHADHAVQVIGINDRQPDHPLVIINDPGSPDGKGLEIPAEVFYQAWSTSGYYMVATTEHSQIPAQDIGHRATDLYGGYYNADGTYHYESDNTDRDPQTGAIVRRW